MIPYLECTVSYLRFLISINLLISLFWKIYYWSLGSESQIKMYSQKDILTNYNEFAKNQKKLGDFLGPKKHTTEKF